MHDHDAGDGIQRDNFGLADGWWAVDGTRQQADPEALAALRRELGGDEHPDGPPPGPSVWFVRPGEHHDLWSGAVVELDGGGEVPCPQRRLPTDLPLGAHRLRSDGGHLTTLFVVPHRCPSTRQVLGGRSWGWSVQLPGTRSAASWGHGDLADLARLAGWTAGAGGAVLAHSPLGAPTPTEHQQPSPYYASSRRFWSPLVLRVEDVEGAELAAERVATAARAATALDGRRLDRDEVWRHKRAALGAVWEEMRDAPATRAALDACRADEGLTRFAAFCVLAERHGTGWSSWPAEHRHPEAPEVARLVAAEVDGIDFWRWLQVQADAQLARASSQGAVLMADLPVGFDPDGADAWADQDLLALGCRIGAPPDEFNRAGQDWGLPPYVPWRLRHAAYEPWRDTLRRVLRRAGSLRIDHVMGLFRLYLVPPGFDARSGAYAYQPGSELFDLACMEAALAGALLVGEDLGTVEPTVHRAMDERGVLGYRVGWFEDAPPREWPAASIAMLTTHDLPTVAGLLGGHDATARADAGLDPDPDGDATLRRRLDRLVELGTAELGAGRGAGDRDDRPDAGPSPVVAAYAALAAAGSDLALATLEDAVGQEERPNLPGTTDEHPNWCLALPASIEELDAAGAAAVAEVLRDARPRGAPG